MTDTKKPDTKKSAPKKSAATRVVDTTLRKVPAVRAVGGPAELRAAGEALNDDRQERGVLKVAGDVLLALPAFALLCFRLARDSRTPLRVRIALGATLVYAVSPFDPIPDFIPVIGMLDDLLVVAILLRWIMRSVDPGLLKEHWSGSDATLEAIVALSGR
jgi:uncharacterized membrane protein YkvA (DUF1232 family)